MKKIKIFLMLLIIMLLAGCKTDFEMNISSNKNVKIRMIKYYEKDSFDGYEAEAKLVKIDDKEYYAVEEVKEFKNIDDISINGDIYANLYVVDENYGTDDENQYLFSREKFFLYDQYTFSLRLEDIIKVSDQEKRENKDEFGKYLQKKINQVGGYNFEVNLPNKAISANATVVLNNGKQLVWNSKYFYGEYITMSFKIYNQVAVTALIIIVVLLVIAIIGGLLANRQHKIDDQYK